MAPTADSTDVTAGVCPRCGAPVTAGEEFCTGCGTHFDRRSEGGDGAPTSTGARVDARRWSWSWIAALGLVAIMGAVATGYFGNELRSTRSDLAASRHQVSTLAAARARLAGELSNSTRLSERRATVLRRAKGVLAGVDPVLSSVDELKLMTKKIQTQRDGFARTTGTAIDTLITLGQYLIDTEGSPDPDHVNDLIDEANAKLAAAKQSVARLSSSDTSYAEAATRFDLRATRLSRDVEALRQELGSVPQP